MRGFGTKGFENNIGSTLTLNKVNIDLELFNKTKTYLIWHIKGEGKYFQKVAKHLQSG